MLPIIPDGHHYGVGVHLISVCCQAVPAIASAAWPLVYMMCGFLSVIGDIQQTDSGFVTEGFRLEADDALTSFPLTSSLVILVISTLDSLLLTQSLA